VNYFSHLYAKVLYTFRTCPRLLVWSPRDHAIRHQQNWHDKYLLCVYSVEILLILDSGPVQNVYSTLSNKSEE